MRARTNAVCIVLLAVARSALAQQSVGGLEEVTVTAQRREEKLQITPVTVTALSAR